MQTKQELRQQMRARRSALANDYRFKESQLICQRLLSWLDEANLNNVMFYWPTQEEVDLRQAMEKWWELGQRVILPRTHPIERSLSCYAIETEEDLQVGNYQIMEPDPKRAQLIVPQRLQAVIVPGTAFDLDGYRLGYGGGYYDRFLAANPHVEKIGIAYEEQICQTVYPAQYDQPITILITPGEIIYFTNEN